jgi:regulatory protein
MLAGRAHSRAELRLKLRRRGHDAEEIESALARLEELGYLDEAAFARAIVARRAGQLGRRAIVAELAAKGVARDLIASAVAGIDDEEEVAAVARLLSRRRESEAPEKTLARLARRGFSRAAIAKAWRVR